MIFIIIGLILNPLVWVVAVVAGPIVLTILIFKYIKKRIKIYNRSKQMLKKRLLD